MHTDQTESMVVHTCEHRKDIRIIFTRGQAPVAERSIRTFKDMLYKRIGENKSQQWTELIAPILLTYNYKMKHRIIEMTPSEARKPTNHIDVKNNMELKAKHGRKYKEVVVGDFVRIFKKKETGAKQQQSYWSAETHEIISISESIGQKFYKVAHQRPLLRHEILKQNT